MPNTYSQLYAHVVFSVKKRENLISINWKEKLYQYITGIIKNKNQKLMIINGMPDHLHLLIGFNPDCSLSDLVRDIKSNASKWINENHFVKGKFEWQTGFGAFSVSPLQIKNVIKYIANQEEHHRKKSFQKEYIQFLQESGIEFKMEYLLEDFGDAPTELGENQ
jgi:REP element-mobilizing transposase RayT